MTIDANAPSIAFQGELGAFSEEAVHRLHGGELRLVPCRDNLEVARLVADGAVTGGVLPVENTLAGSVAPTYDAIVTTLGVFAVAEVVIPIHHCVLAPSGATIEGLRSVESHPVALAQCQRWIEANRHVRAVAAYDTAGAARDVAAAGDPTRAAIAGRAAEARYGLLVLAADVEDRSDNQTRFVALSGERAVVRVDAAARTMLVLTARNEPGALVRMLEPIARHGLNMTKIESRPTGEAWTYRFVVEFEHSGGDPRVRTALDEIGRVARECRVVGTYEL